MKSHNLLLISHNALSMHSNNGKTLQSLFYNWPPESLAQLYFQDEIPESNKFSLFYRVRDLDIIKSLSIRCFSNEIGSSVMISNSALLPDAKFGLIKRTIVNYLRRLDSTKLLIRDWLYGGSRWRSRNLMDWVKKVNPDSIFFLGGNSIFSFRIALALSENCKIPLDIYITDDYIINRKPRGYLDRWLTMRLKNEYIYAFNKARHVFVIGDMMAATFSTIFKRNFLPIMNPVPIPLMQPKIRPIDQSKPIVFCYAGGLHLGRDQALVQFAKIISKLRDILHLNINLNVYSRQKPSPSIIRDFESNSIEFCGPVDASALPEILAASHFVLHVESFDDKFTQLTKLSVSTKIPEYLVSGSCMVAFGPADLASIKIVKDNNIGVCISTLELALSDIAPMLELIVNDNIRNKLIINGYNYAREKFAISEIQHMLTSLLKD